MLHMKICLIGLNKLIKYKFIKIDMKEDFVFQVSGPNELSTGQSHNAESDNSHRFIKSKTMFDRKKAFFSKTAI